jgi:hypothetical protein
VERRPLNGVRFMAMGELIALSVAAEAMGRHGETWEGPPEIALASYARRFEVSRAQVRRVLLALEPCGLARSTWMADLTSDGLGIPGVSDFISCTT